MGIDACFDNEMDILDEQLEADEISREEYDKAVREIEQDMRDLIGKGE